MIKFCYVKGRKIVLSEDEIKYLINKYIHDTDVCVIEASMDFERLITLQFAVNNKTLPNAIIVTISMLVDKEKIGSKEVYNIIENALYKITRFDFEYIYDKIDVQDYGLKIDEFFIPNYAFDLLDPNTKFYINGSVYFMSLTPQQYIGNFVTKTEIDDIHINLALLIDEIEDIIEIRKYPITIVLSKNITYICNDVMHIEKIPIDMHKLRNILSSKEWSKEKLKLIDCLLKHSYGLYDKEIRNAALNKLKLQIL